MIMDLSIVIVNWNTRQLLLDCLASIYQTISGCGFEVFVVDNASSDGSVEAVQRDYSTVNIIQNTENLGFAKANNQALRLMKGRYALLLNTDAVLTEGAVGKLIVFLEKNHSVGMACGQLLNADGSKQNSIANFPRLGPLFFNETLLRLFFSRQFPSKRQEYSQPVLVESCIGACLLVRKKAIDQVGLLDERYFFFMEETDWALAMKKAGWDSFLVPEARIYHLQGQSAGNNVRARIMFYRSRYQYIKKWCPETLPLWVTIIVARLLTNVVMNCIGTVVTCGLVRDCRERAILYSRLLGWHLRGCP